MSPIDPHVSRYHGQKEGFYESYFLRANHPTRPLAFWIRYTLFSPKNKPEDVRGELWAICFDGETGEKTALKSIHPWTECAFSTSQFAVRLGSAELGPGKLSGSISSDKQNLTWDLSFSSKEPPLLLLPSRFYTGKFPPAKILVGTPLALYNGRLTLNGMTLDIQNWIGSETHNWGTRHTDHYAWGQVAGFDEYPESFLEIGSASIKILGVSLPFLTPIVLRHRGKDYALNSLLRTICSKASLEDLGDSFLWKFSSENSEIKMNGQIVAPKSSFVGLRYSNPPGGIKQCLNTKIAACTLTLTDKKTQTIETLVSKHRAAFKILTDSPAHGVKIYV